MPAWHLYLFGPPRLERDASPARLPRRKTLALLAYLAVLRQPQSRQALMSLLWPDDEPQRAAGYLRRSLYELNQALGEGALAADREAAGLVEGALWLDVAEFQARLQDWRQSGWACEAGLGRATAMAELYGGDFLAGFSLPDAPDFDEWTAFQAEGLRRDLAQLLERLANCLADAGRPEAALAHARRWLALDPLNEAAHRALMRLYALSGQPAAARRQYEELSRRLQAELGVGPAGETRELHKAVLAGKLTPPEGKKPQGLAAAPRRSAPGALPVYLTPLVGRESSLDEVCALVTQPEVRLLTVLGPGGVGKTRLAVEAARRLQGRFRDGACFVPLAALSDPATLAPAIAQALDVQLDGARAPADELEDALRDRELLLVLDNFEQLLLEEPRGPGAAGSSHEQAAPLIGRLLAAGPGVRMLVTSRAGLGVYGERLFPLPTLALPQEGHTPASPADLLQAPAVRLFVERARASQPAFALTPDNAAAVAAVCRRLDGLPLAIELAAARTRVMSPAALLERLERALPLLTGGARDMPERQHTLRRTIAWSYDLLDAAEQAFFRGLAVFAGGFDLPSAAAVNGVAPADGASLAPRAAVEPLDLLTSLVNKSLVVAQGDGGEPRFRLLETIREFALEQLEAAEEETALRRRHANYFLRFIESMGWVPRGPEAPAWLDRVEAEHDNMRAALRWALAAGEVALASQLAVHLEALWEMRGYGAEGLRWFESVLAAGGDRLEPQARSWALWGAIRMALHRHDLERTARYNQQLLALREHLSAPDDQFVLLHSEASMARQQGDYDRAVVLFDQLVEATRALWPEDMTWSVHDRAELAQLMGDTALAESLYPESLAGFRSGEEWVGVAWSLHNQAYLAQRRGELVQARSMWEESLKLFRQLGARDGTASALAGLAAAAHAAGDDQGAARLFGEADAVLEEADMQFATVARAESPGYREAVRQALGDAAFDAAYQAGRRGGRGANTPTKV